MNQRSPNSLSEATAKPLVPAEVAYLIEDRPLLWYESDEEYEALLSSVLAELDPKGTIEVLLVKDVADYIWEARRMRRLKVAAIDAELPSTLSRIACDAYQNAYDADCQTARSDLLSIGRGTIAGVEKYEQHLNDVLSGANISEDVLTFETYKACLKPITAINAELERLERRRDQILKTLSDRRSALAAMARSLMSREQMEATASASLDKTT